jgi:ethanolamine utilization cobalamin adenosyltransferase
MHPRKPEIVTGYAKMWPRSVFDIKAANRLVPEIRRLLREPGVYILYRDDQPYYVGKASRLSSRI